MNPMTLKGDLVRLAVPEPERDAPVMSRWMQDSEYLRLIDDDPARLWSTKDMRTNLETEPPPNRHYFTVHRLDNDQLIGEAALARVDNLDLDCWTYVILGERESWDHGYGSDAMRLLLWLAFRVFNRHRVSVSTFEYNPRVLHASQKLGFVVEGRLRGRIEREGRRWDEIVMGILRSEWEKRQT